MPCVVSSVLPLWGTKTTRYISGFNFFNKLLSIIMTMYQHGGAFDKSVNFYKEEKENDPNKKGEIWNDYSGDENSR